MPCGSNQILRKGYTRSDGTRVKAVCVPDKGSKPRPRLLESLRDSSKGKGSKTLPKPTPGSLGKYGYHDIKHTLAGDRRKALTKAVKTEGYAPIVRRLNLIANYTKVSDSTSHKIYRSDIAWIQKNLWEYSKGSKKSKKSKKSKSSKSSKTELKAGTYTTQDGKRHQLYHAKNSDRKYYKYPSGGRRYI